MSKLFQCRNLSKNQVFTRTVESEQLIVAPTGKGKVLAMQRPSQRWVNSLLSPAGLEVVQGRRFTGKRIYR